MQLSCATTRAITTWAILVPCSAPDGAVVTVYYYNDDPEGERFLDATIWKP